VSALPRLLAGLEAAPRGSLELEGHVATHGPLPDRPVSPAEQARLRSEVRSSGLTGRGGAGFPTAEKLEALARSGRRPLIVVNGTEGEPRSAKDRVLLGAAPHLVLDGAVVAAWAAGARRAEVVVVAPAAVLPVLAHAVAERARFGPRLGTFELRPSAPGLVAGEERSVVNWLEGGPAIPTPRPPWLFERGLAGRPTLVHNPETLAHLALVARHGAAWFRQVGMADDPGSTLLTLGGDVSSPGVIEVARGISLSQALDQAGGPVGKPGAFLLGGELGTWLSAARAERLRLDRTSLERAGASLGAGVLFVLAEARCGIRQLAAQARLLAGSSAGQCGPCVHGLAALAAEVEALAEAAPADLGRVRRFAEQIEGRGGCRHPDGAVHAIRSGLEAFAPEVALHLAGRCREGALRPGNKEETRWRRFA
jgi:NADH:ubiquinone oxidoreductase subunit F (NADH-binding)